MDLICQKAASLFSLQHLESLQREGCRLGAPISMGCTPCFEEWLEATFLEKCWVVAMGCAWRRDSLLINLSPAEHPWQVIPVKCISTNSEG